MNAFRRGRLHFVYRSKTKQAAVGLYRILLFQIRPEPEPDLDLGSCFGSQNNTPDETNGINKWQQCCLLLQRGSTVQWFFWYHTVSWTKLWNINRFCIFTLRRYALYGLSYRNSVRLSVTLVQCVHMVRPTMVISTPYGSPIILVSGDIKCILKFEGGHPERGRWMTVGWVRIGDFRPISHRISETVRDTTKVTINH